ncbi:MAG: hypothetical protein ACXVEF_06920 [Polyangiales bacterium]
MTLRSKTLLALACLGLVVAFGPAAAQTAGGGKVDVNAGSDIAPGDQTKVAEAYITKVEASAKRVRHMLDEARRNKDVIKATCLSDKLAQIEVALKGVRERVSSLKAAAARGDTDLRNHEMRVATVLKKRSDQLDTEANQCIGEELGFPSDDTKVVYTIDPNIAPDDPGGGGDPIVTYVPPLPASPFN